MGRVLLGTSGWSYDEWVGPVYDRGEKSKLAAYSRIFSTAEIDSTFYAYPSKGTVMGWLRYTDPDFVFTAKVPKLVTHEEMLDPKAGAERDLKRFCDLMSPLALNGKLGCLLIQLPPRFNFDPDRLERFLKVIPHDIRFAVEFRHTSWIRPETTRLLQSFNVAYTIVDEPLLPSDALVSSDIAYIRWHGKGKRPWYNYRYSMDELKPWMDKVNSVSSKAKTVYGYFNNHYHGFAVENCAQMLELMGLATPSQVNVKMKVQKFLSGKPDSSQMKLDRLPTSPQPTRIESLMTTFIDEARMERAREISDDEVKLLTDTNECVKAQVREYHIVINLETREILHDCSDWNRRTSGRQFCKHIAKVMLVLPVGRAEAIMQKLSSERTGWRFEPYHTE